MKYDVKLQFIPGKYLYIPDTLSRAHPFTPPELDNQTIDQEATVMIHTIYQNLPATNEKLRQIEYETRNDETLQLVKNAVINGWPANTKGLISFTIPIAIPIIPNITYHVSQTKLMMKIIVTTN